MCDTQKRVDLEFIARSLAGFHSAGVFPAVFYHANIGQTAGGIPGLQNLERRPHCVIRGCKNVNHMITIG